jgi:predicted amino acid racemase
VRTLIPGVPIGGRSPRKRGPYSMPIHTGVPLEPTTLFAFVGDEESGEPASGLSDGARAFSALIASGELPKPDMAIYVEPTMLDVYVAHMGFFLCDIKVIGKSAYFGAPELGVDALKSAHRVLAALWRYSDELSAGARHPLVGAGFILPTGIQGGGYIAAPGECTISLIAKIPPGVGHLGHLVQIPRGEADEAPALAPDWWTVFNLEKASEAGAASLKRGREQALLARVRAEGDQFYRGHEGGFSASDILAVASALDKVQGARFAGITTFPALLFDAANRKVKPTPNLETLRRASETLARAGRGRIEINAPGAISSVTRRALAEAGATQVEPGHGLTGTTPLHAVEDLAERPAVVYLTEVSQLSGGEAFCFGGGLYIDPVSPAYQARAVVSREPGSDETAPRNVEIPDPAAIDYYGMIDAAGPAKPRGRG